MKTIQEILEEFEENCKTVKYGYECDWRALKPDITKTLTTQREELLEEFKKKVRMEKKPLSELYQQRKFALTRDKINSGYNIAIDELHAKLREMK